MLASALDRFCVVLVSPRNPLNIGAAARAMSNFGFRNLRVVNPYALAFREARSAVGASAILANAAEFASVPEAITDCTLVLGTTALRKRELQHPMRDLTVVARELQKNPSARVALLFGSEKRGLSNEDLSYCHWLIRIPTRDEHPSMNLGQAVAVCLYELTRSTAKAAKAASKEATAAEVDRLTSLLTELLFESGYLKPRVNAASGEKVRRLVRRLEIKAEDADTLLGMLRQIAWKLRNGSK